jgi:hypothetical protein
VLSNRIKNTSLLFSFRMLLCVSLLFSSAQLRAQTDEDSAITITEEVKENPPDEESYDEDNNDTDKKEYFLNKWEYEGDSLSVLQRKLSDSLVKKMQADKDFWYANASFEKEKKKEQNSGRSFYVPLGQRAWFQTLVWLVIIGGFAAFLMIYLTGSNVGLFRKKNVVTKDDEEEGITEDIFAINYQKEIDKAAMQGNYRLAVRLMYLRLLKNMSEKNIIQYKQDKTNFDYLLQLHPTKHYNSFFRITRNYEYSWYGKFDVSEQAYSVISSEFDQFDRELR